LHNTSKPHDQLSVFIRFTNNFLYELKSESQGRYSDENFFSYTTGRFLFDEEVQLRERYKGFSVKELQAVAINALHAKECVEMVKLAEGSFNKVFLLTMNTGEQTIARIPHPNAGPAHYTTASEVATMHYLRTKLQLPIPKVIDYSSDATNSVGSEYILMERVCGPNLSTKWDTLNEKKKRKIVDRLAQLQSKLLTVQFSSYGNLYFKGDIDPALSASQLYNESSPDDTTYCIGPTTEWRFWEPERTGSRGPCIIPLHNVFNRRDIGTRLLDCCLRTRNRMDPNSCYPTI